MRASVCTIPRLISLNIRLAEPRTSLAAGKGTSRRESSCPEAQQAVEHTEMAFKDEFLKMRKARHVAWRLLNRNSSNVHRGHRSQPNPRLGVLFMSENCGYTALYQ